MVMGFITTMPPKWLPIMVIYTKDPLFEDYCRAPDRPVQKEREDELRHVIACIMKCGKRPSLPSLSSFISSALN
jgi:hypothetical protein